MVELPPPQIREINGYTVVDDYSIGTKFRMAVGLVQKSLKQEFFYATLHTGNSPEALARACSLGGKHLTLVTTQIEDKPYPRALLNAQKLGATVIDYPVDSFEVVTNMAEEMSADYSGELIDFDNEASIQQLAEIARSLNLHPWEVWSASGKGAMSRAYQMAWPNAEHFSVDVLGYSRADFGKATIVPAHDAPHLPSSEMPPFACNAYYEGKAFPVMKKHTKPSPNVLFWNP